MADRFDAAYYRRYYESEPVHDEDQIAALAAGVLGLCRWWGVAVRTVLDVGAGPGLWGRYLAAHEPEIRYRGVDASEYACRTWGHERADIATWRPRRPADLVVCQGVLQYLADDDAAAAIGHLAAATGAVLFLEVPTRADLRDVIQPEASDLAVHWRSGAWYRRLLAPDFVAVGAGLWAHRHAGLRFYELERAERRASAPPPGTIGGPSAPRRASG